MRARHSAYRALLRLCHSADRDPAQLVPLLGRPPRLYNPDTGKAIHAPPSSHPFVDEAIWEACGGSTEYAHPSGSATGAARQYLRLAELLGEPDLGELRKFGQKLVAARMLAVRLRALPSALGPVRSTDAKVRPQIAAAKPSTLLRLAANSTIPLQAGHFLITHPLSGIFEPIYDQAVIVLLRVDHASDTAQGLILNRPGDSSLQQLLSKVPSQFTSGTVLGPDWPGAHWTEAAKKAAQSFSDYCVYQGGPIVHESLDDSVLWLHSHGDVVPEAWKIAPSISLGGDLAIAAAMEHARRERGSAGGLRMFRGFSAWSLSQLKIELERGVWIRAQASCPSAAFELCLGPALRADAWRSAMEAAGLPALARFPRGSDVDEAILQFVEDHQRSMAMELVEAGRR